jgi:hypothetical protein
VYNKQQLAVYCKSKKVIQQTTIGDIRNYFAYKQIALANNHQPFAYKQLTACKKQMIFAAEQRAMIAATSAVNTMLAEHFCIVRHSLSAR